MKTYLDCIPCFIRQTLDACRKVTDDEIVIASTLKKAMQEIIDFDLNKTPPEMAQKIHRIIRQETNNSDPYKELKIQSNERALEIANIEKTTISESKSPFETAVRFAIAGNIIDFGAKSDWDENLIMSSFKKATQQPIDLTTTKSLYNEVVNAKTVLVLGDNAGEAVFDRLLIENFPGNAKVTYAVKDSPIINDVTKIEAEQIGMHEVSTIISNGTDVPGTALDQCSDEFTAAFNKADVVISKGQGNFETLSGNDRKIYFLFQVKCSVIANNYGLDLGDWMVTTTDKINSKN